MLSRLSFVFIISVSKKWRQKYLFWIELFVVIESLRLNIATYRKLVCLASYIPIYWHCMDPFQDLHSVKMLRQSLGVPQRMCDTQVGKAITA